MGSSASKASRAAGAAARKYPARPAPTARAPPFTNAPAPPPAQHEQPGPTVRPQPQASGSRDEAIDLDASDPDFARSLRSLGAVQPNPTLSPTSAFPHAARNSAATTSTAPHPGMNPALAVLQARARLQAQADREFDEVGTRGYEGRRFVDVWTIRQILGLRDKQGESAVRIERELGLRLGVVQRLGGTGVVGLVQDVGRAARGVDVV